ncbi:hypothetical protein JCM8547_005475 [Rhodosporidiobolus lusitaniae]
MVARRDLVLLAALVVGLSCGTNYSFSAYAPQIASKLSLSSTQTNLVGSMGNLGVYLTSPLIGRIVDRKGPVPTLVFALVALSAGYLVVRLFYQGGTEAGSAFDTLGVVGLAAAQFAIGAGSTAGLSSAGNSVAKSYKKKRAAALSVVLSGFGLSAFWYSSISSLLLHRHAKRDTTSDFLLLLSIGCAVSMAVGLAFVRPVLYPSLAPPVPPSTGEVETAAAAVPVEEEIGRSERTPLLRTISSKSVEERNVAGGALLRELDFYLIFLFNGLCAGIGLTIINNLGTIVRSLAQHAEHPPSARQIALTQSRLVSLLSFCNFLGRLISGFGSDHLVHHHNQQRRLPRVWWLCLTSTLFLLSQLAFMSVTSVDTLAGPTVLVGLAHGALFGISGIIGLERFGMANFSTNNGILALAPAFFGQSTNLIFGRIYDSHTSSSPSTRSTGSCAAGRACYLSALHLTTGMAISAIGIAFVLATTRQKMKIRAA